MSDFEQIHKQRRQENIARSAELIERLGSLSDEDLLFHWRTYDFVGNDQKIAKAELFRRKLLKHPVSIAGYGFDTTNFCDYRHNTTPVGVFTGIALIKWSWPRSQAYRADDGSIVSFPSVEAASEWNRIYCQNQWQVDYLQFFL